MTQATTLSLRWTGQIPVGPGCGSQTTPSFFIRDFLLPICFPICYLIQPPKFTALFNSQTVLGDTNSLLIRIVKMAPLDKCPHFGISLVTPSQSQRGGHETHEKGHWIHRDGVNPMTFKKKPFNLPRRCGTEHIILPPRSCGCLSYKRSLDSFSS